MRRLRISAISFLNTAPLMWDFERGGAGEDFEISYTVPSRCADSLREGSADIGIIPVIEYARIPGLVMLPDVAIAARGPVRSILLVSKKPIDRIRTIAADTSSRTTTALTRLLFAKWWGGERELIPHEPQLEAMLERCDAAILIGDAALQADTSRYLTFDLAEEWQRLTRKPFVFAVWVTRLVALQEMRSGLDLASVFRNSRDNGTAPASINHIAREWSDKIGLTQREIVSYLTRNIHYSLDRDCVAGLELFYALCAHHGIIAHTPTLRFLGAMRLLATVTR